MSETPRTDAHATPKGEDGTDWINADFARLLERELATMTQAVGLASTIKGEMPMRPDDPIGMMQEIVAAVAALRAQLAEARKENDTLRGLLGNSAKPCPYCGLAAEDQAKCQHGFPGCSRADDQMLSKHFADAYRAEQAEAQLAEQKTMLREAFGPELCSLGHPAYVITHLREERSKVERLWKEATTQLAERDAEIAALKRHAEAMYESLELALPCGCTVVAADNYRAAYPKED